LLLWNSTAVWRRVFWGELFRRYSEFRREENFPEIKRPGFAPAVFEKCRAPQETVFFCSGGIPFTQSTIVGVLLCGKFST
jgi:hypothetical protein